MLRVYPFFVKARASENKFDVVFVEGNIGAVFIFPNYVNRGYPIPGLCFYAVNRPLAIAPIHAEKGH